MPRDTGERREANILSCHSNAMCARTELKVFLVLRKSGENFRKLLAVLGKNLDGRHRDLQYGRNGRMGFLGNYGIIVFVPSLSW